jgi:cellulose synthase operon protein B
MPTCWYWDKWRLICATTLTMSVLLQRQRDMLVQPHGTSGIDANNRRTPQPTRRNVPANKVEVSAQAPIAAILGMQSPHP